MKKTSRNSKLKYDDWENNQRQLTKYYKKILNSSYISTTTTTTDLGNLGCILPKKNKPLFNIEKTPQDYWRLRYQKKEYIKNEDGSIRKRKYQRKYADGTYANRTRKDRVKGSIYLHHLSIFINDPTFITCSHREKHSFSHLCGNPSCFNPDHIVYEPHIINISRIACCSEYCVHRNKCLKPLSVVQAKIISLEDSIL